MDFKKFVQDLDIKSLLQRFDFKQLIQNKRVLAGAAACVVGLAVVLTTLGGDDAIAQQSPFRVLDSDGNGNCIFSESLLNYQEENSAAYQNLKTEFVDADYVYVRCYYGKTLQQYETGGGKVFNSLRDKREWYADLVLQTPSRSSRGDDVLGGMMFTYDPGEENNDQQRFDIGSVRACDFRMPPMEAFQWGADRDRCPQLREFTRILAEKNNESLPFTARFCVQVLYEFADEINEETRYDRHTEEWVTKRGPGILPHRISESCFDYTVTS